MAYTTIKKSKDHFDGKIYLGSSSAVTVTGLEFQPDLVWVKDRDNGNNHCLVDAVRGTGKYISSNLGSAEINNSSQSISAFTSDGFTTGINNPANEPASTTKGFMSWNWLANGTGVANTDGSISSTVSANTTSGFSIVSYTGTGANATVGHGLGVAPKMIHIKNRTTARGWISGHESIGWTKNLYLDGTNAEDTRSDTFNNTSPTSSVFSIGSSVGVNENTDSMIAYCFAEKQGYSKFGSYTGNGSTDGTFVYTGFKPAFLIVKKTDSVNSWVMFDNKRSSSGGSNEIDYSLTANEADAEETGTTSSDVDFCANGVKIREDNGGVNASGGSYIYMAFAEEPLVGDNPATAR